MRKHHEKARQQRHAQSDATSPYNSTPTTALPTKWDRLGSTARPIADQWKELDTASALDETVVYNDRPMSEQSTERPTSPARVVQDSSPFGHNRTAFATQHLAHHAEVQRARHKSRLLDISYLEEGRAEALAVAEPPAAHSRSLYAENYLQHHAKRIREHRHCPVEARSQRRSKKLNWEERQEALKNLERRRKSLEKRRRERQTF